MNYFDFNKNDNILLYGINNYSEKQLKSLTEQSFKVIAFFDKRGVESGEYCNLPIYKIEDNPFIDIKDKDNFCIIIMLQNAIQHDDIVEAFCLQGFYKFIFVPMSKRLKRGIANNLRVNYNYMMEYQYKNMVNIPCIYKNSSVNEIDSNSSVIADENNWKLVWLPIELIYTNPSHIIQNSKEILKYADIPLIAYFPYIELFKYLDGKSYNVSQYLNEYGVNSCKYNNDFKDKDILIQRKKLFDIFQSEINMGMDFFISSAPPVEWNKKGFFNLMEGQHRSVFLLYKGLTYLPVRMNINDFDIWINSIVLNKLIQYIKKNKITQFITPLPHPAFKDFPSKCEKHGITILSKIQEYLGSNMLKGKSVIDISNYQSYFARNAMRMGAKSVKSAEVKDIELVEIINRVLYTDSIELYNSIDKCLEYSDSNVVFALGVLENCNNEVEKNKIINLLDMNCKELLFWESSDNNEKEMIKDRTGFKNYIVLGSYLIRNKISEVGVFLK